MLDEGAQRDHREQRHGRGVPPVARGVADQPHHQGADRPGLGEGQHPARHAGADHDGQRPSGGQQVGEDLRVQRTHRQWLASAVDAGMWCTEIRLRKTQ